MSFTVNWAPVWDYLILQQFLLIYSCPRKHNIKNCLFFYRLQNVVFTSFMNAIHIKRGLWLFHVFIPNLSKEDYMIKIKTICRTQHITGYTKSVNKWVNGGNIKNKKNSLRNILIIVLILFFIIFFFFCRLVMSGSGR